MGFLKKLGHHIVDLFHKLADFVSKPFQMVLDDIKRVYDHLDEILAVILIICIIYLCVMSGGTLAYFIVAMVALTIAILNPDVFSVIAKWVGKLVVVIFKGLAKAVGEAVSAVGDGIASSLGIGSSFGTLLVLAGVGFVTYKVVTTKESKK